MFCPECLQKVNALSTRCQWCTTRYGHLELWLINLLSWVLALGFLALLIWWIW